MYRIVNLINFYIILFLYLLIVKDGPDQQPRSAKARRVSIAKKLRHLLVRKQGVHLFQRSDCLLQSGKRGWPTLRGRICIKRSNRSRFGSLFVLSGR